MLYALRLGILGMGLGVMAGTALTTFTPTRLLSSQASALKENKDSDQDLNLSSQEAKVGIKPQAVLAMVINSDHSRQSVASVSPLPTKTFQTTEEMTALKQKLEALAAKAKPKVIPQAYFVDLDNGKYVNLDADTPIAAASTIKIPVAIAFFQDVDAGKIKLDELLPIGKDVVASGSGDMQYQQGHKAFTALETVTKMITNSDNTATNMIVKRLGGKAEVNKRIQQWGLSQTVIQNTLPDLEGTNTTSPHDLAQALLKINQGELLSLKSRDRLLGIMQHTKTQTLLPQGLEPGAIIAHKTGDIGTVLGDAGIIDMPNGKRYIGVVMAKRPYNDSTARILIQDMSRTTYQHLKATTPPALSRVTTQAKAAPVAPKVKPQNPAELSPPSASSPQLTLKSPTKAKSAQQPVATNP
jgi:beta-lactamase class A